MIGGGGGREQTTLGVRNYGVLKGRVVGRVMERDYDTPHYQIHLHANETDYRVAVNIRSHNRSTPELLFYVAENFAHIVTEPLPRLPEGFHRLRSSPGSPALDYVRDNLFDRRKMVLIPHDVPGRDNDLNEKLEMYIRRAEESETAYVYAFGSRWGPERRTPDKIFGFRPGNGVHNIHMNQGNPRGQHGHDNGIYQDGGILIHFPETNRWIGIFLAFQSQRWHSYDRNRTHTPGEPVAEIEQPGPAYAPGPDEPDFSLRIIAAMVNPPGGDTGRETVTLLNTTAHPVNLKGWRLMDMQKRRTALFGVIPPGGTRVVKVSHRMHLANDGGIITLVNPSELKVHGVSYTKAQAHEEGATIAFQ
jgi:uncharacterized protein YukJ